MSSENIQLSDDELRRLGTAVKGIQQVDRTKVSIYLPREEDQQMSTTQDLWTISLLLRTGSQDQIRIFMEAARTKLTELAPIATALLQMGDKPLADFDTEINPIQGLDGAPEWEITISNAQEGRWAA